MYALLLRLLVKKDIDKEEQKKVALESKCLESLEPFKFNEIKPEWKIAKS